MTTYYITTTGNDTTGNGSLALPWLTFGKAILGSVAGDTINIGPGTFVYDNQTITGRTVVGTIGSGVTTTTGWTVFTGTCTTGWAAGTGTTTVKNIWFNACVLSSTSSGFIRFSQSSAPVLTVLTCRFSNCVGVGGNGGSIIVGSSAFAAGVALVSIGGCIFDNVDCTSNNVTYYFSMRGVLAGSTFYFYNNTFIVRTALTVAPTGGIFGGFSEVANTAWTLKNNIFINRQAAQSLGLGATATMSNCCYIGNITISAAVTQVSCINTEPLLVDENNGNFILRPTSPCIDTGTIV